MLITEELIAILFEESVKMGAERFIIEDRAAIAKKLVGKADDCLKQFKDNQILIDYYRNPLKNQKNQFIANAILPWI